MNLDHQLMVEVLVDAMNHNSTSQTHFRANPSFDKAMAPAARAATKTAVVHATGEHSGKIKQ